MLPLVFVVSSASGVGKTTLSNMLRGKYKELGVSTSVTTRAPRSGEMDGVDYYFVSQDKFNKMVQAGEFIEYATVYGHSYGTLKSEVDRIAKNGEVPLFDIDWQGAKRLREVLTDRLVLTVYLLPPSVQVVYDRLRGRKTDDRNIVHTRMEGFFADIAHAPEYDYVLINDQLEDAFQKLCSIYEAARLRGYTLQNVGDLVHTLNQEKYNEW